MTRKRKMTRKKILRSLQRTSWRSSVSIWQGRERPVTPWIIAMAYQPRPLRKKRREPRELRIHHH